MQLQHLSIWVIKVFARGILAGEARSHSSGIDTLNDYATSQRLGNIASIFKIQKLSGNAIPTAADLITHYRIV